MRTSQPHPDLHDRLVPAWDAMIHPSFARELDIPADLKAVAEHRGTGTSHHTQLLA